MSSIDHKAGKELETRARVLFDDSVAGLDAHTCSKLAQARSRALELGQRSSPWWLTRGLVPGGAVAAAVAAVWFLAPGPATQPVELSALQDLEILLGEEELEMLEELDFYTWLDEQLGVPEGADDSVG